MKAVVFTLIMALGAVAWNARGERATTPTTAPTTQPTTDGFAPIAYYEEVCSRCHGQFGSGYLPDMGKRLSDDALRKVIRDMAEGPAAAPLDEAQLEAELAYHRSFIDGAPFVARTDAKELKGEVTAGSTVTVAIDGKVTPATVEGQTWSVAGVSGGSNVQVIAERDGKRTTLQPGTPYSHGTPLPR